MDPRIDLRLAEQRRAQFERRAVEYRYARCLRSRRFRAALPAVRPQTATPSAVPACCPA